MPGSRSGSTLWEAAVNHSMRRRDLLVLAAGVTVASPIAARAQGVDRVRRVGVLHGVGADDSELQSRVAVFLDVLRQLGWVEGRNLRIDRRSAGGSADSLASYAAELAGFAPDAILATGTAVEQLLRATRAVPIVFVIFPDPVGSGIIDSLSRPGGNVTGFMQFEYSLCGKWLELLKQIGPDVKRVAVLSGAS